MPRKAKNQNEPLKNIRVPRGQIQAMRIVVDLVKSGHFFYRTGWISLHKLKAFALEMHQKIGVGLTAKQREYRRKLGFSVGHLLVVQPFEKGQYQDNDKVFFCTMWSKGSGYESVFPQYFDARLPFQRLIWETKRVEKEHGKFETLKSYVLTHCDMPTMLAKKRGGEIVLDGRAIPVVHEHHRTLTWQMTSDTYKRELEAVQKRAHRLYSASPRRADGTSNGRRLAAIEKYAQEIQNWVEYLYRRPGFHGVNKQRFTLCKSVESSICNSGLLQYAQSYPTARVLLQSALQALRRPSPSNPHIKLAWSSMSLEDLLRGMVTSHL